MMNIIKNSLIPIILSATIFAGCAPEGGRSTASSEDTASSTPVAGGKQRGIRLDPGYFYNSHPGQDVATVARDVVNTIKNARGNTIYLYAYNTLHGAFYPTTYAGTKVEPGYGAQNVFGAVTKEAKSQGLKIVAVVPLNNFQGVWTNNPTWRSKQAGGADYVPMADTFLLSASSPAYRAWYTGFIQDLIARNPGIDQVEAVEPTMDYSWNGVPDQNPAALANFATQYPGAAVGSQQWLDFRAKEFLSLIALFNQTVHAGGKQTGLVHTWTVMSNGKLSDATAIKNSTGFDWIAVSKQSGASKTDQLVSEFIWQQWFSTFGTAVFIPDWILTVAKEYTETLQKAGALSEPVIHVEISNFSGSYGSIRPTNEQLAQNMANTAKLPNSVSVYDYNQMRNNSAFEELSNW